MPVAFHPAKLPFRRPEGRRTPPQLLVARAPPCPPLRLRLQRAPLPPRPRTRDTRDRPTPGGRGPRPASAAFAAPHRSPAALRGARVDPARAARGSVVSDRRDRSTRLARPSAPPPGADRRGHIATRPTPAPPRAAHPRPPASPRGSALVSSPASPAWSPCHHPTASPAAPPPAPARSRAAGSSSASVVFFAWVVSSGTSGNPWSDSHSRTAAPPAFQLDLGLTRFLAPGM